MPESRIDVLLQIRSDLAGLKKAQTESKKLSNLLKTGLGVGVGFGVTQGIGRLVSEITGAVSVGVRFNATIEQQTVAFQTLLGSVEKADERVRELVDFAAKTPFELPEILETNKVLEALSDGALSTSEGMRLVGDTAAALGRPIQDVSTWFGRLYAGLQSGTPVGEATLRLLEMGIVSGKAKQKLDQLARTARSGSESFQIMEETFSKFSGSMELQSQTLNGLNTTLSDTLRTLAGRWTSGLFEGIKESIQGILVALDALPSSTERAVEAIEQRLEKMQERVAQTISPDETRAELLKEIEAAARVGKKRTEELEEIQRKITFRGRVELARLATLGIPLEQFRIMEAELDTYNKLLRGLREELVKFDGLSAAPHLFPIEEIQARLKGLDILSKTMVDLSETSKNVARGTLRERGLTEEEDAERIELLRQREVRSQANTAEALAKTNREKEKQNALDRKNAALLAAANKENVGLTESVKKLNEQKLKATQTDEERSVFLRQELATLATAQAAEENRANLFEKSSEQAVILENIRLNFEKRRIPLIIEEAALKKKISRAEKDQAKSSVELQASQLERQIDQIRHQKEIISLSGDTVVTRNAIMGLVDQEKEILSELIALWTDYGLTVKDPEVLESIANITEALERRRDTAGQGQIRQTPLQRSQQNFASLSDPLQSFQNLGDASEAAILDYQTQVGSLFDQIHESLLIVQQDLSGGIAQSIEGLIKRTTTWGEAFENVGSAILNSVIRAFAQMLANWITTQLTMLALGKTFGRTATRDSVLQAITLAKAWAPAAVSASIATQGGAAVTGTAAYIAGVGVSTAASVALASVGTGAGATFAEGGYTGPGGKYDPRGIVHAGEFVMPSDVVSKRGPGFFYEQMSEIRSGTDPRGGATLNLAVFDSRKSAERWAESQEFETRVVELMELNKGSLL